MCMNLTSPRARDFQLGSRASLLPSGGLLHVAGDGVGGAVLHFADRIVMAAMVVEEDKAGPAIAAEGNASLGMGAQGEEASRDAVLQRETETLQLVPSLEVA